MFIVQVSAKILPRYLGHYLVTDSGLTPVITVNIQNALPMTKADADIALIKLLPLWADAQVIEVK